MRLHPRLGEGPVLTALSLSKPPRKHFIPVSSSYGELYNLQAFFSGFPTEIANDDSFTKSVLTTPHPIPALPPQANGSPFSGDRALQAIAESGRDWRQNYVRKADMEVRCH